MRSKGDSKQVGWSVSKLEEKKKNLFQKVQERRQSFKELRIDSCWKKGVLHKSLFRYLLLIGLFLITYIKYNKV